MRALTGIRWLGTALAALALGAPLPAAADHSHGSDDWPDPHPSELYGLLVFDQLEGAARAGSDAFVWDVEGWYGGDTQRAVLKTEGERSAANRRQGEAEVQLLWSRGISPFWDLQLGVRRDVVYGPGPDHRRSFAVLGLEGLAPQWLHVEPALFVSDDGDTSARVEVTHELLITQRLIAQSRAELDAAFSRATEFGVESGLGRLELGLRLRYEARREIAPYLGVTYTRRLGGSADLARRQDTDTRELSILAGVHFWY